MQKNNIELLPDLYNNFAQFIYVVKTKYFAMDFEYAMPISILFLEHAEELRIFILRKKIKVQRRSEGLILLNSIWP
jgi:hypothetical protein